MPDKTPEQERKFLREKKELEDFDEQHYMADLMEPECIEPYISYIPEWYNLRKEDIMFTDDEIDLLKSFPNREYIIDDEKIPLLLRGLIDILYGSCYNYRTTLGDNTVESGWTINKLSSTLCWFQVCFFLFLIIQNFGCQPFLFIIPYMILQNFSDMNEVINACIRRALCYPILRNWDLAIKVFEDVKQVVTLGLLIKYNIDSSDILIIFNSIFWSTGKKYIIKRLCEIHRLFTNSYEPRHLLNQFYINDYSIWLQSIPESLIESLTPILDNVSLL